MKERLEKIKWLYIFSKPYIISIIFIVTLGSINSLLIIYRAIIMKNLIDNATSVHINKMIHYLIIFGVFVIIGLLLDCLISIISTRSYTKMCNRIQKQTYLDILNSRWDKLSRFHSGDITTRITSDTDSITTLILVNIPNILSTMILLIGSFITLLNFDHTLALLGLLLSPTLILLGRYYSKKLKKLYLSIQQNESKFRSLINESIQNIVIIKSFCLQNRNSTHFENLQKEKYNLKLSQNNISIFNNLAFSTGSWTTFFLVFIWGAFKLSNGSTTYGTMTALLQLFGNIQVPLNTLSSLIPKSLSSLASAERLMELQGLTPDPNNNVIIETKNLGVQFNNVGFSYNNNTRIINDLSLEIKCGETVGLIGSSGEGKTTLIRLILSLTYPTKGNIYITDANKKFEIDTSCRKYISYVPQGNTLFSGTIAENLRFGNEFSTEAELEAAAKATSALDFIKKLDNGFNTTIGERGLGLSEGQAQRLAISRALLKKSPILILDEATSALDSETELKVLNTIKNLQHKPTCIIITHRPSALSICNRILKLENGHLFDVSKSLY